MMFKWILVILIVMTTTSIISFANQLNLFAQKSTKLEQKLNQILCNLNVKSIYIQYDDALKTSIVDRVIQRSWQCPNIIPIRVLL